MMDDSDRQATIYEFGMRMTSKIVFQSVLQEQIGKPTIRLRNGLSGQNLWQLQHSTRRIIPKGASKGSHKGFQQESVKPGQSEMKDLDEPIDLETAILDLSAGLIVQESSTRYRSILQVPGYRTFYQGNECSLRSIPTDAWMTPDPPVIDVIFSETAPKILDVSRVFESYAEAHGYVVIYQSITRAFVHKSDLPHGCVCIEGVWGPL
jgi:hypothetical protein